MGAAEHRALDGYAASHGTAHEMPAENMIWKDMKLRSSKYLSNMIEQDHWGVKSLQGDGRWEGGSPRR